MTGEILNTHTLCRYLFYILLVFVSWLALTPQEGVFITTGWDKANHYLAFFTLLLFLDAGYPKLSLFIAKIPLLFLYAGLIEVLQSWIPGREASLLDLLADSLGLLAYVALRPFILKVFYYFGNSRSY